MTCNNTTLFTIKKGSLLEAEQQPSPHFSARTMSDVVDLLVIHNISLPAGVFGGNYVTDLFLGKLDINAHESFQQLANLRVSAHCLIRRDGHIIQYVNFNDKAWHAGISEFLGKAQCNDFSIGIELEGTDILAYTEEQYERLIILTKTLQTSYPLIINEHIVGHCDIAPLRKTDPGSAFNWHYFRQCLQ